MYLLRLIALSFPSEAGRTDSILREIHGLLQLAITPRDRLLHLQRLSASIAKYKNPSVFAKLSTQRFRICFQFPP